MSSKRNVRRKQCTGKIRYTTLESAKEAQRLLWAKGRRLQEYGCRFCGGFHLGHLRGKTRKQLSREGRRRGV